jgi:hypothetical protein
MSDVVGGTSELWRVKRLGSFVPSKQAMVGEITAFTSLHLAAGRPRPPTFQETTDSSDFRDK